MERDPQTSTRKQRREQARIQRKDLERAAAARRTRKRRVKLLGITAGFVRRRRARGDHRGRRREEDRTRRQPGA
jgi:hypothetical protein